MRCRFCDSTDLRPTHRGLSHPRKPDHGPFDVHACNECGSTTTWPVPSREALAALYGSFASGVDPTLRELREDSPLSAWFQQVVRRTQQLAGVSSESTFRWIDVGAGGGELSIALSHAFPLATGVAVDWAPRPALLGAHVAASVDWQTRDLNEVGFASSLPQAELVVSLSVWEHVLDPSAFLRELLQLVAPGGVVYLVCPDAGSLAARLLGRRWPYFIPGEHLHMPTAVGARRCIDRAGAIPIEVGPVGLPYPPSYVLGYLGLRRLSRLARSLPAIPLPVGALETACRPASV